MTTASPRGPGHHDIQHRGLGRRRSPLNVFGDDRIAGVEPDLLRPSRTFDSSARGRVKRDADVKHQKNDAADAEAICEATPAHLNTPIPLHRLASKGRTLAPG